MSSYYYSAYGIRLSSNQPLPGLTAAQPGNANVSIKFVQEPLSDTCMPVHAPIAHRDNETFWAVGDEKWLLRYNGPHSSSYVDIQLNQADSSIQIGCTADILVGYLPPFVLTPLLSAALYLRGILCLHASAVVVGGRALLLCGVSGAGKSTLAATFVREGYALLSDDIAALDMQLDDIWVHPGIPRIRLWSEAARMLEWVSDLQFNQLDDKQEFDLSGRPQLFSRQSTPLAAICMLGGRRARGLPARVVLCSPRNALPSLVENIYAWRWQDPTRRAHLFRACARIVERIPVYQVEASECLSELPQLARTLVERTASLRTQDIQLVRIPLDKAEH